MILLMLVGFGLFLIELFVPSGGILGILAGTSLLVAAYFAFTISLAVGVMTLVGYMIAVPIMFAFGMRVLPRTPFGRLMVLPEHEPAPTAEHDLSGQKNTYSHLMGRTAKAVTSLRPAGMIEIDGERIAVVTEGDMIHEGQTVKISEVSGNRVVVSPHYDGI